MPAGRGDDHMWDAAGTLSIVVQGGLSADNAVETALHCAHWRALFPHSQIILAISTTDLLARDATGVPAGLALAPRYLHDGTLLAAMATIGAACDTVVHAEPALPLPTIKSNREGANNVNLQLAAAKAGLAAATGRFALRVRSDLIFADRSFLDQYAESLAVPRGPGAKLGGRVLVSYLYTLNPFTHERMPLHVSDWFHFGGTADLRTLWAAPPMTLVDALFFQTHAHADDARYEERFVLTRLAVEQHILYACFRSLYPDLSIERCNDRSSVARVIDILADEFVMCDLAAAACVFEKYARDFENPEKAIQCVTRADWFALARARGEARIDVLRAKAVLFERPALRPFPRHYPPARLHAPMGHRDRAAIFAADANGVLLHGPYDPVGPGRYVARVHLAALEGSGTIAVRVTAGTAPDVLAERIFVVRDGARPELAVPFDVTADDPAALEVIVSIDRLSLIVATGVSIEERSADRPAGPIALPAAAWPMRTAVGRVEAGGIATTGVAGHLLHGPYTRLAPGAYRATFTFVAGPGTATATATAGGAVAEIAGEGGRHRFARRTIRWHHLRAGSLVLDFVLPRELPDAEFRVRVGSRSAFTVGSVTVTPRR